MMQAAGLFTKKIESSQNKRVFSQVGFSWKVSLRVNSTEVYCFEREQPERKGMVVGGCRVFCEFKFFAARNSKKLYLSTQRPLRGNTEPRGLGGTEVNWFRWKNGFDAAIQNETLRHLRGLCARCGECIFKRKGFGVEGWRVCG